MAEETGEFVGEDARFAANVKRLREERGWSQGELARRMVSSGRAGFHQTTISRIEKGERPVRISEAVGLAEVFDSKLANMVEPPAEWHILSKLGNEISWTSNRGTEVGESVVDFLHAQELLRSVLNEANELVENGMESKKIQLVLRGYQKEAEQLLSLTYSDLIDQAMRRENGERDEE